MHNRNRQLCNDNDKKKALCGRKIDLLVSSMSINLSSSEWKKATAINSLVQAQQIKNSRTNSAILHNLAKLPISGNDKNKLFTLGMDWIGKYGCTIDGIETDFLSNRYRRLDCVLVFCGKCGRCSRGFPLC